MDLSNLRLYSPSLNDFRVIADFIHLFAMMGLLIRIWGFKTCSGISGRTQILMLFVFVCRYLDLAVGFRSVYNETFKILFMLLTLGAVYSILVKFRKTYDLKHDTFPFYLLIIQSMVVAMYFTNDYSTIEVLWTFSIHLEVVALIPQVWMCYKSKKAETAAVYYVMALGLYRAFYIFNWIIRYEEEGYFYDYYFISGLIQVVITFAILVYISSLPRKSQNVAISCVSTDNLSHLTKAVKKILKEGKHLKTTNNGDKHPIIFQQDIPANSLTNEEKTSA
uniref:ER lumen protein-retaining receptor n=1 Tax=Panagrolaimus sp. JU765 TaxID=591449 RepID=A0AC34QIQ4_9BILA